MVFGGLFIIILYLFRKLCQFCIHIICKLFLFFRGIYRQLIIFLEMELIQLQAALHKN